MGFSKKQKRSSRKRMQNRGRYGVDLRPQVKEIVPAFPSLMLAMAALLGRGLPRRKAPARAKEA